MYPINEISNRDLALLYSYRILRKPSDFLSAALLSDTPVVTEIFEGAVTDLEYNNEPVYAFPLDVNLDDSAIPYLEFDVKNDIDRKKLESLLYLDNGIIYSKSSKFTEPVQVRIYQVNSLDSIKNAVTEYLANLDNLNLADLQELIQDLRNRSVTAYDITGTDNNLVQYRTGTDKVYIVDSHYMITSALDSQLLVNPSQELLMSLPRRLKHSIDISITDGGSRYLSSFSGHSINISGNGNWVFRDVDSSINLVSGSGNVYFWNSRLVHLRNTIDDSGTSIGYHCNFLHAHRSLIILNQGIIDDLILVGGSTFVEVPSAPEMSSLLKVNHISLIGHGCSFYSWVSTPAVDTAAIYGLAWMNNASDSALYIGGRRIDEASGEHDAELQPSKLLEYRADGIYIH